MSDDATSSFPSEAVDALTSRGAQDAYVPDDLGGRMQDVLLPMLEMRNVARRDLTVAVAHGKTFLGALPSWIAGGPSAAAMSDIVRSGDPVSWGLTEQGRGSDLLRSATTAKAKGNSFTVDGAKWPINNATRGRAMSTLVRTNAELSPRSLTLLLIDKRDVDSRRAEYFPKVLTHGIRGADISGVAWTKMPVHGGRAIGEQGQGLELVLKALQITRPVCTALSLGASDQATEAVLDFVSRRTLYGRPIRGFTGAHHDVGAVVADALIAEATSMVSARHVASRTEEMALVSALTKFVVPATVDSLFRNATGILGARSQISGVDGAGRFEKANRDNRVVGIFDGNSIVNLHSIINQFRALSKFLPEAPDVQTLAVDLDPGGLPQGLDFKKLRLVTKTGSSLLRAVPELCAFVSDNGSAPTKEVTALFAALAEDLMCRARATRPTAVPGASEFEIARGVAEVFAGACCLLTSIGNSTPTPLAQSETWLVAALGRLCSRLGRPQASSETAQRQLGAEALELHATNKAVSLFSGWRTAA